MPKPEALVAGGANLRDVCMKRHIIRHAHPTVVNKQQAAPVSHSWATYCLVLASTFESNSMTLTTAE